MRTADEHVVATTIIRLMNGVVYRETHEDAWRALERHGAPVRDHFAEIGIDVVVNDVEGYAYLLTLEPDEGEEPLPRLVKRRALTYHVSLLLLLLRKRLAEFESSGDEGKLVLERDQIVEMLRVFLRDTTNEARTIAQVDATISQVAKLGFLRELRGKNATGSAWEVKRILKAYVDAQTMGDFAARLAEYADTTTKGDEDE